jgi:ABC-type multidrug transport system ATPase subunit
MASEEASHHRVDAAMERPNAVIDRAKDRRSMGGQKTLLILDEPTSGLDPLNQQEFNKIVAETRADGRTIFLSSHILPEVEQVCDRVGIIREGELVRLDAVSALKDLRHHEVEITFAGPAPGTGNFSPQDAMEFMQKMWNPASFPMPGMITPTVNLEEIDKKIFELKAVENWLTMSTGFVQMTIKTLQLQKSALESLQAARAAAAKSMNPEPPKKK